MRSSGDEESDADSVATTVADGRSQRQKKPSSCTQKWDEATVKRSFEVALASYSSFAPQPTGIRSDVLTEPQRPKGRLAKSGW